MSNRRLSLNKVQAREVYIPQEIHSSSHTLNPNLTASLKTSKSPPSSSSSSSSSSKPVSPFISVPPSLPVPLCKPIPPSAPISSSIPVSPSTHLTFTETSPQEYDSLGKKTGDCGDNFRSTNLMQTPFEQRVVSLDSSGNSNTHAFAIKGENDIIVIDGSTEVDDLVYASKFAEMEQIVVETVASSVNYTRAHDTLCDNSSDDSLCEEELPFNVLEEITDDENINAAHSNSAHNNKDIPIVIQDDEMTCIENQVVTSSYSFTDQTDTCQQITGDNEADSDVCMINAFESKKVSRTKLREMDKQFIPTVKLTDVPDIVPSMYRLILIGHAHLRYAEFLVIQAVPVEKCAPLDIGSILCFENRTIIGAICDTFGKVDRPFYLVECLDNELNNFEQGQNVFADESHCSYLLNEDLSVPEYLKDRFYAGSNRSRAPTSVMSPSTAPSDDDDVDGMETDFDSVVNGALNIRY